MITQGYPLTAAKYEVADTKDGQPIYRATGDVYAVVGWLEQFGDTISIAPVLVNLSDLTDVAFVPEPGQQFEFVRAE